MKKIKIPTGELLELVKALLDAGEDPKNIPGIVGEFLDDLINFKTVVKGPIGIGLEAIDGPVFKAAAAIVVAIIPKPNPA